MSNRRFDRSVAVPAARAGLAALTLAIALGGCVNVAQQGVGADAPASGVPVASAPAAAASGTTVVVAQAASAPAAAAKAAVPPQAVKPASYKVRRGDTVKRIAQKHHITVKQLLAWNRLKASARVKPGQTLIVSSPDAARNATTEAATAPAADTASADAQQTPTDDSTVEPPTPAQARDVATALSRHANGVSLAWPAQGSVVETFQPGETRGIEIGGKPGDPVRAAADGKVMYAGTGLNEYGSLIIVQHNKDFLTAYSHNRKLLVRTGDIVRKGQQIAEMGSENNTRVSVGFEVRRDGKPVDPMPYLPSDRG
ncbi:peptidoglycan DD-metalloendopeptidase family protein [Paraburkholderia humisilvae]|uniref:Murein hydrolase activator NlpD n=1 Tax=Paraburkholderia humisilvae TaxID=627669 RepID=A0A6J5DGG0_9BURK|nr:peptidoglycan DD-metalloendopeptidase family protein [Paraburkholderia humisilvae]CAB3751966.1 Murein hydrolase activator NlpD [Paraburkholderia humisilvae]